MSLCEPVRFTEPVLYSCVCFEPALKGRKNGSADVGELLFLAKWVLRRCSDESVKLDYVGQAEELILHNLHADFYRHQVRKSEATVY